MTKTELKKTLATLAIERIDFGAKSIAKCLDQWYISSIKGWAETIGEWSRVLSLLAQDRYDEAKSAALPMLENIMDLHRIIMQDQSLSHSDRMESRREIDRMEQIKANIVGQ